MSFLARMVKGREASSPKDEERDRFEAVEKICNRLSYASLLEDRRSAAQALKSVSKQYQKVLFASPNNKTYREWLFVGNWLTGMDLHGERTEEGF